MDGDYSPDRLDNREKGKEYFLAVEEDMPRLQAFGAAIERRRETGDGVKAAFDLGGNVGDPVKVRGLTVLSMSNAQAKVYRRQSQVEADRRCEELTAQARASGGEYTTQARASVV